MGVAVGRGALVGGGRVGVGDGAWRVGCGDGLTVAFGRTVFSAVGTGTSAT
jgi:hypothetical protein